MERCRRFWNTLVLIAFSLLVFFVVPGPERALGHTSIRAVYLGQRFDSRSIDRYLHYAELTGINGAVLHVKDPRGFLYWPSQNPLARQIGAIRYNSSVVAEAVKQLRENGHWTIAKIDVFADDLLAWKQGDMALFDGSRGSAWRDRNELAWTNPYDSRVWEYIIALSEELVDLGFDEIQFDYVRFPSDGNLECISYPLIRAGWSKSQAIVAFLEQANRRLKPKGAVISVDLFGMVAWKREFGIGQVLEEIAPHVDVICPMLYPSHFPAGFLGWAKPENHPRDIMAKSLARMQERTDREIRPWIQGFWYEPFAIQEQFEAVEDSGISGWTVWNPAARYQPTYQALAQMREVALNEPQLYPSLAELEAREPYLVRGNFRIVNYTDYREGFSIVSLDESKPGRRNNFATPAAMLAALDEAIIDHVLTTRNIAFTPWTTKARKQALLAGIMCADTGISPTRMRAVPIYLDWKNSCTFSLSPPPDRIALYKHLSIRPS